MSYFAADIDFVVWCACSSVLDTGVLVHDAGANTNMYTTSERSHYISQDVPHDLHAVVAKDALVRTVLIKPNS